MNNVDINSLSILPPSSLRDIVSLILILNFLPSWINGIVFVLYILSGSTKFIGGKLFLKYFEFKTKQIDESFFYGTSTINYHKLVSNVFQVLTINSVLLVVINFMFPSFIYHDLDILAKTIVAAELIGSTDTLSFISSQNPHPGQHRNSHSHSHSHSHGHVTKPPIISNSNGAGIGNGVGNNEFNGSFFDSNTIKTFYCYVIILTINSVHSNFNFPLMFDYLKRSDFNSIFSKKVLNSINNEVSRKLITNFDSSTSYLQHLQLLKFLRYLYYELCITVIITKFNPVFSTIGLKKVTNNLDQLNNINPNIPIDFKRNKSILKDEPLLIESGVSNIPVISLKDNENHKKLVDIPIPVSVSNAKPSFQKTNSISVKNFESFVLKLFTNRKLQQPSSTNVKLNKNSNATLIIDRNLSIIQPFWSLLAVLKLVFKNSNSFQGKPSTVKNNSDNYSLTICDQSTTKNELLVSVELIDDTKVLVKFLKETPEQISIKLNGLIWEYFKVCDQYLLIYALSPISQYEIEISDSNSMKNILVNTISNDEVLKESVSTSTVETLQASLISTIETLDRIRIELKEYKKDETKKHGEVKKNNDSLLDKIIKVSNNDEQNMKKIKGLRQSIKQFEADIELLKHEISASDSNDISNEEAVIMNQVADLQAFITNYEASYTQINDQLREVADSKLQTTNKIEKFATKTKDFELEIQNYVSDIDQLRSSFIGKIQKRLKIINDNFDTILPRIKYESLELEKELNEIKNQNVFG